MPVLLLHLAGPMQSWGTQSRFTNRDTGLEPSKSGVIGLLCAAMGKPRDESKQPPPGRPGWPSLETLAGLPMGIRVDRQGIVQRDYHTAGGEHRRSIEYGVPVADGKGKPRTVTSDRFYLADADFWVALHGEDADLLRRLDQAVRRPVWQMFLGRKAFVPSAPIHLDGDSGVLSTDDLEQALTSPPLVLRRREEQAEKLRLEIQVPYGQGERVKHDQPLSFLSRQFAPRHVKTDWLPTSALKVRRV